MEWIATIGGFWLNTLGWLAGLAIAFGILARLMPCNPGMYWWKDLRAVATDFLYWFIVPLFLRICRTLMLIAGVALLFGSREPQFLPVKDLPLWQQCLLILLIQDVILYWIHRIFHSRLAWKFHAIHHSPKVLDWTSTGRFHPINNLLEFALADIAVLLMGFSPAALIVLTPINLIYSAMVHANLNWTFGPLRYVFASPVFHRWHHTTQEEGINKNFASTFPILDVIFGTFHMPPGRLPDQFGNGELDFPEDFWGQFIHPFRRKSTQSSLLSQPTGSAERTRRRPAARAAIAVLAVVCLLGAGMSLTARLTERNAQLARRTEQGGLQSLHAGASGQANQPNPALPPRAKSNTAAVSSVAISADGQLIVSGNRDGTVKIWDAAMRQERLILTGHTGPVTSVAISADGQHIVSGSYDQTLKVWDCRTGQDNLTLIGHTGTVISVAISADSQHIVSGSADGMVKIWDGVTGQEKFTLMKGPGAVLGVAISADGRRIVSASWEAAKVWDTETGQEILTLKGHTDLVYTVAISSDGKRIVSGSLDEKVKIWDAETGQEMRTLTGHMGTVTSVAISANGQRIVSGGEDKTGKVWDTATGQEKFFLTGHKDALTSVAISADGRRIISGSRDGTMKLWDSPEYNPEKLSALEPLDGASTAQ